MRLEAKLCVIIAVMQYNIYYRCYSKVDGGIKADMEAASHIVLQNVKGVLHLKTC